MFNVYFTLKVYLKTLKNDIVLKKTLNNKGSKRFLFVLFWFF